MYRVDQNDPTKADCGSTDGVIRMVATNVNCPTCLEWHDERVRYRTFEQSE